ncbi:hypothetical protein Plhal304r1_c003g0010601 [Plasmopara halstedii]
MMLSRLWHLMVHVPVSYLVAIQWLSTSNPLCSHIASSATQTFSSIFKEFIINIASIVVSLYPLSKPRLNVKSSTSYSDYHFVDLDLT